MKITILAPGSRGDVQPCVVLGMGLKAAGYEVRIATHDIFETYVIDSGLEFFRVHGNPMEMLENKYAQAVVESSGVRLLLTVARLILELKPYFLEARSDLWDACQSTDSVIYSPVSLDFGPHIVEKLNVPAIAAFYTPIYPTSAFPIVFFAKDLRVFNRLTWVTHDMIIWFLIRLVINRLREEQLELSKIPAYVNYMKLWREAKKLILMGVSHYVVPKPEDWGDNIHITGYWFPNALSNWRPPSNLVDFITSGTPPICLGFGSMKSGNPKLITDIVLKSLVRTKQRCVLVTGWGGIDQVKLPENVFQVESVPFDWLLPKVAAVVHHGGAGTTAAALRAGIPSVIVPFSFDNPFWGRRMAELGVGTKPIPFKKLTAERLANAITQAISDKEMRERAAGLGERIRIEDGVGRAVDLIRLHLSSF